MDKKPAAKATPVAIAKKPAQKAKAAESSSSDDSDDGLPSAKTVKVNGIATKPVVVKTLVVHPTMKTAATSESSDDDESAVKKLAAKATPVAITKNPAQKAKVTESSSSDDSDDGLPSAKAVKVNGIATKQAVVKAPTAPTTKKTAATSESSDDDEPVVKKPIVKATLVAIAKKPAQKAKAAESSSSDDSDDGLPSAKTVKVNGIATKPAVVKAPSAATTKKTAATSESSDDDEPAVKKPAAKAAPVAIAKKPAQKAKAAESSSSDDSDDGLPSAKTVKVNGIPPKVLDKKATASSSNDDEPAEKKATVVNLFKRARAAEYLPDDIEDDRPLAKKAKFDGFSPKDGDQWGVRASNVLSRVRGKNFRHEKTKMKRGTYSGGRISQEVNSTFF